MVHVHVAGMSAESEVNPSVFLPNIYFDDISVVGRCVLMRTLLPMTSADLLNELSLHRQLVASQQEQIESLKLDAMASKLFGRSSEKLDRRSYRLSSKHCKTGARG